MVAVAHRRTHAPRLRSDWTGAGYFSGRSTGSSDDDDLRRSGDGGAVFAAAMLIAYLSLFPAAFAVIQAGW
jgi:hypothetical protein